MLLKEGTVSCSQESHHILLPHTNYIYRDERHQTVRSHHCLVCDHCIHSRYKPTQRRVLHLRTYVRTSHPLHKNVEVSLHMYCPQTTNHVTMM